MSEDFRRIPISRSEPGRRTDQDAALSRFDLDTSLLVLSPQGRLTLNLDGLKSALGMAEMPKTSVVQEIGTFAGAGTTGLVPDPAAQASKFLRDDGKWDAPAGSGDMTKAVYDTDNDGLVDKAEQLEGPTPGSNIKTALQVKTHIDDTTTNPHGMTGANVGVGGVGPFKAMSGVTAQFKNINSVSADGVSVANDAGNDEIDIGLTDGAVPIAKLVPPGSSNRPAFLVVTAAGTRSWLDLANDNMVPVRKAAGTDLASVRLNAQNMLVGRGVSGDIAALNFNPGAIRAMLQSGGNAGTSFPGSLTASDDGWWFYRTDLDMAFTYVDAWAGWVSVAEWEVFGGKSSTLAATAYTDLLYGLGTAFDASNIGVVLPFQTKAVWVAGNVQASSTCTFTLRDEGTDVTNATLSYSAQSGKKSSIFVNTGTIPTTIAANRNISIAVTSGSAVTGHTIRFGLRRFET